jgi:putative endonuclease
MHCHPNLFFAFPAKAGNQSQALHSLGLEAPGPLSRARRKLGDGVGVCFVHFLQAGTTVREDRMIEKRPCVYILASHRNGTLYVGVTRDIARRGFEHRMGAVAGFTQRNVHLLVFVESMAEAVMREKRIKKWRRAWKLAPIERDNPEWRDLYDGLML